MLATKLTLGGKEVEIEIDDKNFKRVEDETKLKDYDRLSAEKGTGSLSKFYNYLFTDIVGVSTTTINGTKTEFNTVVAALIDKNTHKFTGKTAKISLGSLTRSNFAYANDETTELKSIGTQLGIPDWSETAQSSLQLLKENVFNKYFEFNREEDFVRPIFPNGQAQFCTNENNRLRVQKLPMFQVSDKQPAK